MKSNNDFKNILDKETISLAEKDRKDKDKGNNFFINKEYINNYIYFCKFLINSLINF